MESPKKLKILVVDDSHPIQTLIKRVLSTAGHQVVVADNGTEALEIANTTYFDAAIVDYDIPLPNGLAVLARIRQLQPNTVRLLISGELDVSATIDAINRGEVARVLTKPFDGASLLRTFNEAVSMFERVGEQYVLAKTRAETGEAEELRSCMDSDMLNLALQPIVRSDSSQVFAFEALLRSQHPRLSTPPMVISVAERQGLIAPLGGFVTRRAAEILTNLPENAKIFINLHPQELADPEALEQRLQSLAPKADQVVLEITERSNLLDLERWETAIGVLDRLGFALAVDDLGCGYSSLSVLAELQPQFIKIDMSIIRGIDQNRHKQRLVQLICKFAESEGAEVIAEGIETPEEALTCSFMGVDFLQGYYFGRPQLAVRTDSADQFRIPA